MARRKRRWRLKRKWPWALLVVFCLLAAGAWGAYYLSTGKTPPVKIPGITPPKGRINVLLLGTDARVGDPSARTDTIILASIDPATDQAALLSVPRDTRIDLTGHGMDKINDADVYGGPKEAMAVVSRLLGVKINYYVLANFNSFKDIINTLGGLTIDVPYNMYHYDPMDGGIYTINLKKGVQHLNGTQALEFVRFRDLPLGDISRTENQQKFLVALLKKTMQPSSLPKLPKLVPEIMRNVHTNLPLIKLLGLARAASDFKHLKVVHQTLPGYFATINGISYWIVNADQAQKVAAKVLQGQVTSQVVLAAPPGVSQETYASSEPKGTNTATAPKTKTAQTVTQKTYGKSTRVPTGKPKKIGVPGASVTFTKLPPAGSGAAPQ